VVRRRTEKLAQNLTSVVPETQEAWLPVTPLRLVEGMSLSHLAACAR
jgi:hypothetical protein